MTTRVRSHDIAQIRHRRIGRTSETTRAVEDTARSGRPHKEPAVPRPGLPQAMEASTVRLGSFTVFLR